MSNSGYIETSYKAGREAPRRKRRSLRQWLRSYINYDEDANIPTAIVASDQHRGFNKSFEGWNIRLHKANGGHIVEAWRNEDGPRQSGYNYKPDHELFMVKDEDDMATALNDILVQLMLRA